MVQAAPIRTDYAAGEVRRLAKRANMGCSGGALLHLGRRRGFRVKKQRAPATDRQTLRDWVIRVQRARAGRPHPFAWRAA